MFGRKWCIMKENDAEKRTLNCEGKKAHRFNQQNVNIYHLCQANCCTRTHTQTHTIIYFHLAFSLKSSSHYPFNWKPGLAFWWTNQFANSCSVWRTDTHIKHKIYHKNLHSLCVCACVSAWGNGKKWSLKMSAQNCNECTQYSRINERCLQKYCSILFFAHFHFILR